MSKISIKTLLFIWLLLWATATFMKDSSTWIAMKMCGTSMDGDREITSLTSTIKRFMIYLRAVSCRLQWQCGRTRRLKPSSTHMRTIWVIIVNRKTRSSLPKNYPVPITLQLIIQRKWISQENEVKWMLQLHLSFRLRSLRYSTFWSALFLTSISK